MVSSAHAVCSKNLYIAMISTTVETSNPQLEIKPALELLGDILEMFDDVSPIYEPTDDGKDSSVYLIPNFQLYITKSYDATSHFEMATNEILEVYTRITGEKLDMNIEPSEDDEY